MHFSINCSTVICSPTVILMLSWEKPLVKPMAPGSIFYHISFRSTFIYNLLLSNLYHKNTKNIYLILLSLSDLTLVNDREVIDIPFIALVARFLFVCVGSWDLLRSLLLDWYLGSQKLREILSYYCCITLSSSRKTNGSSRRSKKDFWRHCRGGLRSSQDIPSTHHKLISLALHYLPFASRFPLPTSPLPFYSPSLSRSPLSFACLFCVLVCWIACHDGAR